jgi:hypothetical protein
VNAIVRRLLTIILIAAMWEAVAILHADDAGGPSVTELTIEQAVKLADRQGVWNSAISASCRPRSLNCSPGAAARSVSTA